MFSQIVQGQESKSVSKKPNIKLPPLGSILKIQTNNAVCTTPVNSKKYIPNGLTFISPSMSDGGLHDASFTGKFPFAAEEKPVLFIEKLKFTSQRLPLTPPTISQEQFSQHHSLRGSSADDTFYHKQSSIHYTSSPVNVKKPFDFYLEQNHITETVIEKNVIPASLTSKIQGLGLKNLKKSKGNGIIKNKKISKKPKDGNDGKFAFILHSTDSYSSKEEPYIDNEQLARQKRRRTDGKVVCILETFYNSKSKKPTKAEKLNMSKATNLTVSQVQVWFQNRRSRDTKNQKLGLSKEIIQDS